MAAVRPRGSRGASWSNHYDYCFWDRRFEKLGLLGLLAGLGALAGFLLQRALDLLGLAAPLAGLLVRYQGDPQLFSPEDLVTNWPEFFFDVSERPRCAAQATKVADEAPRSG